MASQQPPQEDQAQINFLLADFNTRLRDLEEKNKVIRERVLLLGQNLISSREDIDSEIASLKKEAGSIKKDIEKIKSLLNNVLSEIDKFVKKDEIILVERMLKDFQPLEFVRIKDLDNLIDQKINKQQDIKGVKNISDNMLLNQGKLAHKKPEMS